MLHLISFTLCLFAVINANKCDLLDKYECLTEAGCVLCASTGLTVQQCIYKNETCPSTHRRFESCYDQPKEKCTDSCYCRLCTNPESGSWYCIKKISDQEYCQPHHQTVEIGRKYCEDDALTAPPRWKFTFEDHLWGLANLS